MSEPTGVFAEPEQEGGCGYSWDHTLRPGDVECRECGAEMSTEDESQHLPSRPHRRSSDEMTQYRVRKVGRYWQVHKRTSSVCTNRLDPWTWHLTTSYWSMAMWVATGDRCYQQDGFRLVPSFR